MKTYAIVIKGNTVSEEGFKVLEKSLKDTRNTGIFELNKFDATTADCAKVTLNGVG